MSQFIYLKPKLSFLKYDPFICLITYLYYHSIKMKPIKCIFYVCVKNIVHEYILNKLQIYEISFLYMLYFYFKMLLSEEMVDGHIFMSATVFA